MLLATYMDCKKNLTIDESANFANKSAAHDISEIGVRPEKDFS